MWIEFFFRVVGIVCIHRGNAGLLILRWSQNIFGGFDICEFLKFGGVRNTFRWRMKHVLYLLIPKPLPGTLGVIFRYKVDLCSETKGLYVNSLFGRGHPRWCYFFFVIRVKLYLTHNRSRAEYWLQETRFSHSEFIK